jgi:hypothetical protein
LVYLLINFALEKAIDVPWMIDENKSDKQPVSSAFLTEEMGQA